MTEYLAALKLQADRNRGAQVFRKHCMTCHRIGTEGHDLAPNLATVKHRSPEEILLHVLDPNREVPPQYMNYTVALEEGRVLSGIIASETDASVTLRRGDNSKDTIMRKDIEEIRSTGMSIMPEGFEKLISHQEMADLIALLRTIE
jgi:putative heme-binding domain-containing protein